MTTTGSATRVDYKVYIAGVLVPCSDLSVTSSVSGKSTANFSLPAHPLLLSLGETDRLQVAIFYLDSNHSTGELKWCLLFEGFLAGQNFVSSSTTRQVTFFAMSNISAMDNLYLELLGGKGSGKVGKADKITPDEITMRGNYPRRFFTEGLDNKVYIKRPYDLIGNIFLATTGRFLDRDISSKSSGKAIAAQVDRFAEITKLNRKRLLSGLSGAALLTRYKDLLTTELGRLSSENEDKVGLQAEAIAIREGASATDTELEALLTRIDKEVIREEIQTNAGKRNTLRRTPANTGFFARYFNLTKLEQHFVAAPILEGYPDGDKAKLPSGMFPMLRTSTGKRYLRALARQTGRKYGANGNALTFITNLFSYMNYQLTDIIAPGICEVDSNGIPKGAFKAGALTNRIVQHVALPATPFGIPPTCNTILPCMIRNWQMSKQYMSAPTRLYYERASQGRRLDTKSKTKGYADHGEHVGYPAKITRHAQDASKSKSSDLEVLVFPEEYYRGPNCIFTQINPFLREIKKLETAGRLDASTKVTAEDKKVFEKDPIPADQLNYLEEALISSKDKGNSSYALLVKQAQIDYTTARTQAGSLSVSLVFNPNLIAGFSTILFDSFETNAHMAGYITEVTHTLSQGQSSTSVGISHARPLKDVITGILNQGGRYGMHPAEPLTEVREVFQVEEVANLFYGSLLYSNSDEFSIEGAELLTSSRRLIKEYSDEIRAIEQQIQEKRDNIATAKEYKTEGSIPSLETEIAELDAKLRETNEKYQVAVSDVANEGSEGNYNFVLNWKGLIDIHSSSDPDFTDTVTDLNSLIGSGRNLEDAQSRQTAYKTLLRGHIRPKDAYESIFYNLPVAMRFVSRPVCTLEEYIDFYKSAPDFINGASSVTGGRGRGVRGGTRFIDGVEGLGKHYRLIREFVGGPGFEPGATIAARSEPSEDKDSPQLGTTLEYRTAKDDGTIITRIFSQLNPGDTATIQDLPDLAQDTQEVLLLYSDIISSRGKL